MVATAGSAFSDLKATGYQLPAGDDPAERVGALAASGASVRLDMWPPDCSCGPRTSSTPQPLCSQQPLLGTDYPHVPMSRKADYIVATLATGRPKDAIGPPLRTNLGYTLYRENPSVPGAEHLHASALRPDLHRRRAQRLLGHQSPWSSGGSASACALAPSCDTGIVPSRLINR